MHFLVGELSRRCIPALRDADGQPITADALAVRVISWADGQLRARSPYGGTTSARVPRGTRHSKLGQCLKPAETLGWNRTDQRRRVEGSGPDSPIVHRIAMCEDFC